MARKYRSYSPATTVLDYGDVPEGWAKTRVSGFEVYTRCLPPSNGEWHSDGSKLVVQPVYADAHGVRGQAWPSPVADSISSHVYMALKPPTGQN